MPDAPHYTIAEANDAYLQATHSQHGDLIGRKLFEAFPETPEKLNAESINSLIASLEQVLDTGLPHSMDMQRYDIPVRGTDAFEERYWEPQNIPVHNSRDEVICIIQAVKDVTDQVKSRQQYEQSRGLLEALANQSESPMFVRDKEGRYFFTNRKFEQTFGAGHQSPAGETDYDQSDIPSVQPEREDELQITKNSNPAKTEETINTPEGTRHFVTNRFPLANLPGLEQAIGGIATDITQRKQAEAEKEQALHRLQKSNREQTCLYNIIDLQEQGMTIEDLLEKAIRYLPDGWQYPSAAEARIEYAGRTYQTGGYKSTPRSLKAQTERAGGHPLLVEVVYTEEKPQEDEGPFLRQERRLINAVARHLTLKISQIRSQQELEEQQQSLDKAYQLARIGTWEFDMLTHELHWSRVTKEVHGFDHDYEPDLESTINLFKEGVNRETFARVARDAIEHGKPFDVELKIISGQGDERWIRATGEPEYEDGVCTRFYGISQNVSDRRQAEEDLQLSEQRFKSLVQDGSDLIAILDAEFNYTYVSPTSESILGIPAEDFIGTSAWDYVHEEDWPRIAKILSNLPSRKRVHAPAFRFKDAEGNWRWIETTITNMLDDPAVGGIIANSRDVTEHIQREEELQNSVMRYDTVIKATKDAVYDWDVTENRLYWGNSFRTTFGYDAENEPATIEEWAGKLHPDDQDHIQKGFRQTLDSPSENEWKSEYRFAKTDGTYATVVERGFIIRDDEGKAVRMIGALQDITRQKEEENRLKLLESVITNTTDAVMIKEAVPDDGQEGKIVYVNDAFSRMTGYTRDEVIGQTTRIFNGPRTDIEERRRIKQAMERWEPCVAELVNYRKNGEEYWVNISLVPVADQDGNYTHWITIERDITKRKQQEAEMRTSLIEKEVLLTEVHHRVKNNLAVVSGMMQLQAFEESNNPSANKLMNSVTRIKTMAAIHEQLYQSNSFSKLDFSENLKKLVLNIVSTMQTQTKVECKFKCQPVQLNVNQAIPCALIANEVVTNVLKHAFGKRKKGSIEVNLIRQDERLTLAINDNGKGLPEDFDPQNNTSLGLHLVSVLSRQLEADYSFDSSEAGSRFTLWFDVTDAKGIGSAYVQ